jgi:hypothetical protein
MPLQDMHMSPLRENSMPMACSLVSHGQIEWIMLLSSTKIVCISSFTQKLKIWVCKSYMRSSKLNH